MTVNRKSSGYCAAAMFLCGFFAPMSIIAYMVLGLAHRPSQFYPVMTLHTQVLLTSDGARVMEKGEQPPRGILSLNGRSEQDMQLVSATVKLLRPIPMRSGRRGTFQEYAPGHAQPSYDELAKAGPERAVEVDLMHQTLSRSEAGLTSTMFLWPAREHRTDLPFTIKIMDRSMVDRVLPALAIWTLDMSGDQTFADGVLAGGTPIPEIAGSSFHAFRKWLPLVGMLFVVLFFVFKFLGGSYRSG